VRIGIDGHWVGEASGVSTYCRNIFERLPASLPAGDFSIATSSPQGLPSERVLPARSAYFWEQVTFPAFLRRGRARLAFLPDWRAAYFLPRPYVLTLHDITSLTHPEAMKGTRRARLAPVYRHWLRRIIRGARRIITVSHYSKASILGRFPELRDRVEVIHNGLGAGFGIEPDRERLARFRRERLGFEEPYVLSVGRIDYTKNLPFLCRAFLASPVSRDYRLVLCGRRVNAHLDEVKAFLASADPDGRVRIVTDATGAELPLVYNAASLLVHPSLSEGFGLTLLEAMACGLPVLSADNTSLPEVMGGVDGLYPTDDGSALRAKMEKALGDSAWREGLVRAGLENVKRFSWDRSAEETARVLAECAE
jgi:glycosyltransferase involved in cell wall biosynthesis